MDRRRFWTRIVSEEITVFRRFFSLVRTSRRCGGRVIPRKSVLNETSACTRRFGPVQITGGLNISGCLDGENRDYDNNYYAQTKLCAKVRMVLKNK